MFFVHLFIIYVLSVIVAFGCVILSNKILHKFDLAKGFPHMTYEEMPMIFVPSASFVVIILCCICTPMVVGIKWFNTNHDSSRIKNFFEGKDG